LGICFLPQATPMMVSDSHRGAQVECGRFVCWPPTGCSSATASDAIVSSRRFHSCEASSERFSVVASQDGPDPVWVDQDDLVNVRVDFQKRQEGIRGRTGDAQDSVHGVSRTLVSPRDC